MNEYIAKITVPKGWNDVKREHAEKIIEKAITVLNPDIKVRFALFHRCIKWYATKKSP